MSNADILYRYSRIDIKMIGGNRNIMDGLKKLKLTMNWGQNE